MGATAYRIYKADCGKRLRDEVSPQARYVVYSPRDSRLDVWSVLATQLPANDIEGGSQGTHVVISVLFPRTFYPIVVDIREPIYPPKLADELGAKYLPPFQLQELCEAIALACGGIEIIDTTDTHGYYTWVR